MAAANSEDVLAAAAVADAIVNTIFWLSVTVVLKVTRRFNARVLLSTQVLLTPLKPLKVIGEVPPTATDVIGVFPINKAADLILATLVTLKEIPVSMVGKLSASDIPPPSRTVKLITPILPPTPDPVLVMEAD